MSRLERALRPVLRLSGVRSRHVDTHVARHHVYDAPGRGTLPTIVLLPGLCDSAASHVPMLPHLRMRARQVLIVESAGHGLSGPARGEYTSERHLASVTAALDQLLDEPAILVGNSLGGATALEYALVRPERVRGLYLTSPGGAPFDAEGAAFVRRAFTMPTPARAREFVELVFHRRPALAPLLAYFILARASSPEVADILRTVESDYVTETELASLSVPVVLVWGRSERIFSTAALDYFRSHLPAHAKIVELEAAGHCPHLDNPRRLAHLITTFAASTGSCWVA